MNTMFTKTDHLFIYWRPLFKLQYVSKVIMPIMSLHHIKWLGISSIYFNDEKERHFVFKTIFWIIYQNIESSKAKNLLRNCFFLQAWSLFSHWHLLEYTGMTSFSKYSEDLNRLILVFHYSFGLYDVIRCDM